MTSICYRAREEADTERLGAALARYLPETAVVVLTGTLGAGKTRLVQAVARASGVPRGVVMSPTFVLCQEYHGQRTIYHFDVYRLRSAAEFRQLGPDEYFAAPALSFIEWGQLVRAELPVDCWEIQIEIESEDARLFTLTAPPGCESILEAIQEFLNTGDERAS